MRIALLSLFGFLSFTVVCPITMGAMPMDMGGMQMSHAMQGDEGEDDKGAMPCEQCKKEKEQIVVSFGTPTEVLFLVAFPTTFFAFWDLIEPLSTANDQIALFTNGPPLPIETLVGTVILRT